MIGLIDVDSKIPNLALMKLSTYYKSIGETVEFVQEEKNMKKYLLVQSLLAVNRFVKI